MKFIVILASLVLEIANLHTVRIHPQHKITWATANERSVFYTTDAGSTWKELYRLPSETLLSDVIFIPDNASTLILCTSNGLFTFDTQNQLISTTPIQNDSCQQLTHINQTIIAATLTDLWALSSQGHWQKLNAPKTTSPWIDIELATENTLYALSLTQLYRGDLQSQTWQALPIQFTEETLDGKESNVSRRSGEEDDYFPLLRGLYADTDQPNTVYIYSENKIRASHDAGSHWEALPLSGLPSKHIFSLLQSDGSLLATTDRGVYQLNPSQRYWTALTSLPVLPTHGLTLHENLLVGATEKGLYLQTQKSPQKLATLPDFTHEPSIQSLHTAAMQYAELHPEKIQRWRKQARLKALLPSVSLGYDRTQNTYVTSRGSSADETTDRLIFADDPSSGWDVSLSWQLDELIWSSDQTSIDNRSRLTVQLRESILNEVTRLYFERRRLQIRLASPEAYPEMNWEDKLRLHELTAQIDALTNNFLSHYLARTERKQDV